VLALGAPGRSAFADSLTIVSPVTRSGTTTAAYRLDPPVPRGGTLSLEWTDSAGRLAMRQVITVTAPHGDVIAAMLDLRRAVVMANRLTGRFVPDDGTAPRDAETSFIRGFTSAGGKVAGSVRVPVANPDFSAFVQRAKDANPDAIFIFVPGGAQPAALGKALASRGITPKTTKILGNGEIAMEDALKNMGDDAIGIITAFHYDPSHDSALNREFVTAYVKAFGRNPDIFSIGGYDGMRLIYDALTKTHGKTDGQALIDAAKGMAWESPRGPIAIDKDTRDIVQTVYIRRVEKVDGRLVNVEFDKIANVKDPVKAGMAKSGARLSPG